MRTYRITIYDDRKRQIAGWTVESEMNQDVVRQIERAYPGHDWTAVEQLPVSGDRRTE